MEPRYRVAVIGGGLAGLSAARSLQSVCNVFVLEASSELGGRVRQITGLVPWPVEAGPEFLHGKHNSSIKDLADQVGCSLRELPYPDCYYIGSEKKFFRPEEADEHEDIQNVHAIFAGLASEHRPEPDINMADFLKLKGVNETVVQLAQAIYANDFGCSLEKLGVTECIEEAQQWTHGDTYIVLDRPLSCIVDHLSRDLEVYLNHSVEEVCCSTESKKVALKCNGGVVMHADYVIVTVPMKVIHMEAIKFEPPLPSPKLNAASMIGMSNVIKVLMAFSDRFWPGKMFDVVCTGCFVPEFWTTRYPMVECLPALGDHLLVGFIAGDAAVEASKLPVEVVLSKALKQLDEMFGAIEQQQWTPPKLISTGNLYRKMHTEERVGLPASSHFQAGCLVDWSKEEFIWGGYTHPSVHASGARGILGEPELEGRVCFAGEATHPGVNPCMQAAIDTGVRAAKEVIASINVQTI